MGDQLQRRWYLLPWLVGLVVLLVVGVGSMGRLQRLAWRDEATKLEAIATLKANQIVAWRAERLADAQVLTANRTFPSLVIRWLRHADPEDGQHIVRYLENIAKSYRYRDALVVDGHGQVRLSLHGGTAEDQCSRPALQRAWETRAAALTDVHVDAAGRPHLEAVALLLREGEEEPAGAVVLQGDMERFLFPLLSSWPVPSRTAETLLVRREGDEVLLLKQLRQRPGTAPDLRFPLIRTDLPMVRAVLGELGPWEGRDHRGVPVLAAARPIVDSPWYLLAMVDTEEAFAALGRDQRLLAGLLALLGLAGSATVFALWQRRHKAYYRERLQWQQQLHAHHARLGTTLMSIGDAVIATDREARIELVNPVAEQLTGWSQQEAVGRPLAEVFRIVNEKTRQPVEDPVARVLREGGVVGLANHTLLLARDGREIPIVDSGAPIRNEGGKTTGVVLVFRDQTREREAQQALEESEKRYRELFVAHPQPMWVYDLETLRFLEVNDAAVEKYGYSRDEFLGMTLRDIWTAEDIPRLEANIAASRARGGGWEKSTGWRHLTKDGRLMEVEISSHGLTYQGRLARVVVAHDVTQRRQLEEQLRHAQRMEAIGTLAGGIAHDFNNLLQALLTTVQTARLKAGEGPLSSALEEVEALSRRGAGLARQLLYFARRQPLQRAPVDLAALVHRHAAFLLRVLPENIQLEVDAPTSGLVVEADPTQLEQVLTNLAVNARDAMPLGGRLTLAATPSEGGVTLMVRDTGTGMTKEVKQRAFEPFFTTKPAHRGTGLGLSVVWGIVERHGGHITLDSSPGCGTTVAITLPSASSPDLAGEPETSSGAFPALGARERILVVEDEPSARRALAEMLREMGYEAHAVGDAEEALRLPMEVPFDLLLTDYLLPGATGLELAGILVARWPALRVLVMSGYAPEDMAHSLFAFGQLHYLQKPFDMTTLARAVRAALSSPLTPVSSSS